MVWPGKHKIYDSFAGWIHSNVLCLENPYSTYFNKLLKSQASVALSLKYSNVRMCVASFQYTFVWGFFVSNYTSISIIHFIYIKSFLTKLTIHKIINIFVLRRVFSFSVKKEEKNNRKVWLCFVSFHFILSACVVQCITITVSIISLKFTLRIKRNRKNTRHSSTKKINWIKRIVGI